MKSRPFRCTDSQWDDFKLVTPEAVRVWVSMRARSIRRELLDSYGFVRGHQGHGAGLTCSRCGNQSHGIRGWFRLASHEYDEHDCYCKTCALRYCEEHEAIRIEDIPR